MTIPAQRHVDTWTLVARAQAGDGEAFGAIYDRYFDQVYGYVFRRIRNRPITEDITSAVWERALRSIGTVSDQGRDLGAWLHTIARNIINDHYKSARVRLSTGYETVLALEEIVDNGPDPAVEAERSEAAAIFAAALAHLTEDQRQTLRLRYWEDRSVGETAQTMGRHEGAIKAMQYRAVRRLAHDRTIQALRGIA